MLVGASLYYAPRARRTPAGFIEFELPRLPFAAEETQVLPARRIEDHGPCTL
jgi:hypothetical protein